MIRQGTAAVLALALGAATLGAQNRAACDFNTDGSATINTASSAIGQFNSTTDRAEQIKHVQAALKALTDPNARADSTLRNYMLGQALIAYAMIEDAPLITTQGELGYATDPDREINVILAADSAFDRVVAAKPCAEDQARQFRQIALARVMNVAVAEFNAGNQAQASALAEGALAIDPELAPAYHLIGNAAVSERDFDKAFENFEKAAEYAAKDEMYADIRASVLLNLAVLAQNRAESMSPGPEQTAMATKAADYFREHLQNSPDDATAKTGLARSLQLAGDTAAVAGIYAEMAANPDRYDVAQLIDAGVSAINDARYEEAVTLLEGAHRKEPFSRDVNFALSIAYSHNGQYQEMLPVVHRLVDLDPSNADNHMLLSQAFQGMVETGDRNQQRAYGDSLIRTQQTAARMTVKVTFRGIAGQGDQRTLEGDIENLTEEPRTYTINFQLLDVQGNVVGSEAVTVENVAAMGSSTFSVPLRNPAAVAYKYAPVQ